MALTRQKTFYLLDEMYSPDYGGGNPYLAQADLVVRDWNECGIEGCSTPKRKTYRVCASCKAQGWSIRS